MRKSLFLLLLVMLQSSLMFSQVAVNNTGNLPDNSAMLDVSSTTRGMLIPRMSAEERDLIGSPAAGLLIFCTTDNHFYFNWGTPEAPEWITLKSQWESNGDKLYYNNGNIGIGINDPWAKLDVRGGNEDEGALINIGNSDISHRLTLYGGRLNNPNPYLLWNPWDSLRFATYSNETGYSEKMRIAGDGKVGIGTVNPTFRLDVRGSTTDDGGIFNLGNADISHRLTFFSGQDSDPDPYIMWSSEDDLRFITYSETREMSEKMRITKDGKVGIGTTEPTALLEVAEEMKYSAGDPGEGKVMTSDTSGNASWQNPHGGGWTDDGTVVRLTTGTDKVGIGTTSPEFRLSLENDAGILAKGTFGSGDMLSTSGEGTRLVWYPRKAAFRAGYVNDPSWDNDSIGNYSVAMGYNTKAKGAYSTAMGFGSTASGFGSTSMGDHTIASGFESTAMGNFTVASGGASTTMGALTTASGSHSTAMGIGTEASSYGSLVIGRCNLGGGTPNSWVETDPLFEIGIGADADNPANAMTVLKNGNVGIGIANPVNKLEVAGQVKITGGDPGSGKVLTSDDSGLATWQTPLVDTCGWTDDGAVVRLTTGTNKVGIGTASPEFRLSLDNDAGILAKGTFGAGDMLSTSGEGTRLVWYPRKAAFRVGYVDNVYWDNDSIGDYSVAMGHNTKAKGLYSTALGDMTNASGVASLAMGFLTTASGGVSTAMGYSTFARGVCSTTMGMETVAQGQNSTAMGDGTVAGGDGSTAMGSSTTANGNSATVMGVGTKADSYASVAIGRYNSGGGSPTSWIYTDPLFEIGIGENSSHPENALTVLKNGYVGIGVSFPGAKLEVNGQLKITGGGPGSGKVLTSNETGLATWQAPTPAGWTDDGTIVRLVTSTDKVGIGTTNPSFKLSLDNDGGIMAKGTYGSGNTLNTSGPGTRLIWYPRKSAFRVGYVEGADWDNDNIGDYSVAMGYSTKASGLYSTALGTYTNSSGNSSTALGNRTRANSYTSLAIGRFNAGGGTADSWVETDPVFEIGIGTSWADSANAMTVLKNGNIGIGIANPENKLEVAGQVKITGGDPGSGKLLTSDGSGLATWQALTPAGWTDDGTIVRLSTGTDKVGIGTTTPNFKLSLDNDGGILARGTHGSGDTLFASGSGTRLIWYPRKAAFRAGSVNGSQWNNDSIGDYSVAMGYSTKAKNTGSTALGYYTNASGDHSTALGSYTKAMGSSSTSMGDRTTASGNYSTAMGDHTTASGSYSTAMGSFTEANTDYSTAMGYSTSASGSYSTTMGYETGASGSYSTAMGHQTTASGSVSAAMGERTKASGNLSTSMGFHTKANSYTSLAMGRYNVGGGTADSWVSGDPLFEIGIGTDTNNTANAMTVLKNGNVGIGIETPALALDVRDSIGINGTRILYLPDQSDFIGSLFVGNGGYEMYHIVGAQGTGNTAVGISALESVYEGYCNTAVGYLALNLNNNGNYNTSVGAYSNYNNHLGSMNTTIGYEAGMGTPTYNISGNVFIGYRAGKYETGNDKLYIENSSSSNPLIGGDFSADEVYLNGKVGIGTNSLLSLLHVEDIDLGLQSASLSNEQVTIEDSDAGLGLYSANDGSFGSSINLGEIETGVLNNKWSLYRTTSSAGSASQLRFSFGSNATYSSNPTMMAISQDGKVGIGNTNPGYLLTMEASGGGYYNESTNTWVNGCSRIYKQDIMPNDMDVFEILNTVDVVKYRFIDEVDQNPHAAYHIGFIAEDTPELLSGTNHDGMQTGDCIGLLLAIVKEQQVMIEKLQKEIEEIKDNE
jgi:hypothetical protein